MDAMSKTQADKESGSRFLLDLHAWCQLCRLPNLCTAPGDAMAGFLLAHAGLVAIFPDLIWVSLASLCFYTGGLIFNDWADRKVDAKERPHRPLPSSRIPSRQAFVGGSVLFTLGLVCCMLLGPQAFRIGICLCVLIQTYNLFIKEVMIAGPLAMGACRGLNVLLGSSAAQADASMGSGPWVAAGVIGAYVASITHLSRKEAGTVLPRTEAWLPLAVLVLGFMLAFHQFDHLDGLWRMAAVLPFLPAGIIALLVALRISRNGNAHAVGVQARNQNDRMAELPSLIGRLIGGLLFLQAGFIFASGKDSIALVLGSLAVVCWVMNQHLRHWFYES